MHQADGHGRVGVGGQKWTKPLPPPSTSSSPETVERLYPDGRYSGSYSSSGRGNNFSCLWNMSRCLGLNWEEEKIKYCHLEARKEGTGSPITEQAEGGLLLSRPAQDCAVNVQQLHMFHVRFVQPEQYLLGWVCVHFAQIMALVSLSDLLDPAAEMGTPPCCSPK